jgi:hypothetical protein
LLYLGDLMPQDPAPGFRLTRRSTPATAADRCLISRGEVIGINSQKLIKKMSAALALH